MQINQVSNSKYGDKTMSIYEAITEISVTLKENVGGATERLENEVDEFNKDNVFFALVALSDLKGQARDLESRLNVLMTSYMRMNGEKVLEFGDLIAERKFSSSRKNWEHATLLEAVVNTALSKNMSTVIDPNTGELLDLSDFAKPIIDSVVEHVTRAAAIREWRVTALRAMVPGLNPDDFCEVEKAERVSIRRTY